MNPAEITLDLVILDQAGIIDPMVAEGLRQQGLNLALHQRVTDACQTLINDHPQLIVFLPPTANEQVLKLCAQLTNCRSPGQDRLVAVGDGFDCSPQQAAALGIDDILPLPFDRAELGRRLKLMSLAVQRVRDLQTPYAGSPVADGPTDGQHGPAKHGSVVAKEVAKDRVLLMANHHQRAQQVLLSAMERQAEGAILLVQIHSVSGIFRSFGYLTGARLLNRFSQILVACTRAADSVVSLHEPPADPTMIAKVSDADFVVLLGSDNGHSTLHSLSARIRRSVGDYIDIDGQRIPLVFSFGYSRWPEDGLEADQILMAACESARGQQQAGSALIGRNKKQKGLLAGLYEGIAQRNIELFFQPRVEAGSGAILGFEALARWQHNGEAIPPDVFVPLAEEHGMIRQLGLLVAEKAIAQHQRWRDMGCGCVPISINVSPFQFDEDDFATRLLEMCQASGTAPGCLEIEITESSVLHNEAATLSQLKILRDNGVGVALDDFGTGYSSLSHLQKMELDALKIDRSFIKELEDPTSDPGLVVSIIGIGINLGLTVVAEGVEYREQAEMLFEWGCHELQGYFYSQPVDADAATILLSKPALPAQPSQFDDGLKLDSSAATDGSQKHWEVSSKTNQLSKKQSRTV